VRYTFACGLARLSADLLGSSAIITLVRGNVSESEVQVGGDVDEVVITLRVFADDLDPEWVTRLLRVQPTFAGRKGDRRPSRRREIVQPVGMWQLELPGTREWVLDDAIGTLLSRLPPEAGVWEQLAQRARADVFCGLFLDQWNRGADLSYEILGELARRRLGLSLDIYGQAGDEDE